MARRTRSPVGRFVLHYVAMVIAMLAGMLVLYPLWMLITAGVDDASVLRGAEVEMLVMATTMSVGMAAWMWFRGHAWLPIIEMCAAMYASFVVLFPGLWVGALDGHEVMMYGHVLMPVLMLVAMLWRREEYTQAHHQHRASPSEQP